MPAAAVVVDVAVESVHTHEQYAFETAAAVVERLELPPLPFTEPFVAQCDVLPGLWASIVLLPLDSNHVGVVELIRWDGDGLSGANNGYPYGN